MSESQKQEQGHPSGCEMVLSLWKTALECNITDPGIVGTGGRVTNYVKCSNSVV